MRVVITLASLLGLMVAIPVDALEVPSALQTSRFTVRAKGGRDQVCIGIWPVNRPKGMRWPILIALHGMTEAKAGPERGHLAWPEKYGLLDAFAALLAPPLTVGTFQGLVRPGELERLNAELRARPFQGLFVVGVYTPDLLNGERQDERLDAFADFVVDDLLPRVRDVFPVTAAASSGAGIDGVSLGGMVALEVGLRRPEAFRSIGALQPAVRGREAKLAQRASEAYGKQPFELRIASSDGDPLLPVAKTLSGELRKRNVPHRVVVTPGGHDYTYNRGPGSVELLRFHERALRSPD